MISRPTPGYNRRFSEIGLLPDPGIQNPTPTPVPGWDNVSYTYGDPDHVHAAGILLPVIEPLRAGTTGRLRCFAGQMLAGIYDHLIATMLSQAIPLSWQTGNERFQILDDSTGS